MRGEETNAGLEGAESHDELKVTRERGMMLSFPDLEAAGQTNY
jgi:hypothetical protein